MSTERVEVPVWHPLEHPACENCHGLSRPVRPKRKTFERDGVICHPKVIPLELNLTLAFRRHLRLLLQGASVPQHVFASLLGITPPTLDAWRSGALPEPKKRQSITAIEAMHRKDDCVYVVHRVSQLSAQWKATVIRRERLQQLDNADDIRAMNEAVRQLKALLRTNVILPPPRQRRRGKGSRKHILPRLASKFPKQIS